MSSKDEECFLKAKEAVEGMSPTALAVLAVTMLNVAFARGLDATMVLMYLEQVKRLITTQTQVDDKAKYEPS